MSERTTGAGPAPGPFRLERLAVPALIFALCAAVYVATLGSRVSGVSDNAHYLHLADSLLHGELALRADKPPGTNDWAHFEGRWYVSFPPFPALVVAPLVAIWGTTAWDRLFWAALAGLGPACLYVLLRALSERGLSERSRRDNLLLTALFALGSVYYFVAVQGTVWFAAQVVAVILSALFVLCSLRAERPALAGLLLGLLFMTRPTTLLLAPIFVCEALTCSSSAAPSAGVAELLSRLNVAALMRRMVLFALPLAAVLALAMWMNDARFYDPLEFGHSHLQIRWRARIDKWGLFNYHYLAKNLAVMVAALPWISATAPYVKISRHGLALWVTTPQLLGVFWPTRRVTTMFGLSLAAAAVALLNLCYQNSGWVQFGYRFSLDYAVPLFALLALGGRKLGKTFVALLVFAIAINTFGAITFDRLARFYDADASQKVIFQPD